MKLSLPNPFVALRGVRGTSSRPFAGGSNTSLFIAAFRDPDDLLQAVKRLRGAGVQVHDTFTPFPVHGMDDALGWKPSRLGYACAGFALLGLITAAVLQYWTSVVDYPLNVGGKPLNSIPAFVPVGFELTVLFAGLGSVATFFALSRMRPRFHIPQLFHGVNDDRFVLLAEVPGGSTFEAVQGQLDASAPIAVERWFGDEAVPNGFWQREVSLPLATAIALLPALLVWTLGVAFNRNFKKRVMQFDAGMTYPVAAHAFDPHPLLRRGQVLQTPPEGTSPRGMHAPLAFQPGKDEAERAGRELLNPMAPTPANLERGKLVWTHVCAACHGDGAKGDGGVIPRFPNPPNLVIEKYRNYADGRLFHVATFGGPEKMMKGMGDIISQEDRWRVVLHLRELQKAALPKTPAPAVTTTAATSAATPAPALASGVKP